MFRLPEFLRYKRPSTPPRDYEEVKKRVEELGRMPLCEVEAELGMRPQPH